MSSGFDTPEDYKDEVQVQSSLLYQMRRLQHDLVSAQLKLEESAHLRSRIERLEREVDRQKKSFKKRVRFNQKIQQVPRENLGFVLLQNQLLKKKAAALSLGTQRCDQLAFQCEQIAQQVRKYRTLLSKLQHKKLRFFSCVQRFH